ncbi:MAG: hypothetical protein IPP48_11430 [Chitinophagaceae bacterium]|nr:hypothetical protein [Chitinophagaceae bacterium]
MVERGVMFKANCVPDYGSELLGDHAYMLSISSQKGMVYINKSLGGQLVHGGNFGYNFYKVQEKYINTPTLFYNYLESQIAEKTEWKKNTSLLWDYIGRSWVEYSLMLFHSVKKNTQTRKDFFQAFNKIFSNKKMAKWKYKFYLKGYLALLFNILLYCKNKLTR